MTRTELIATVKEVNYRTMNKWSNLYHCSADYREIYINGKCYTVLRSYSTLVALYSPRTGTVYEFDYYSATTTQHVYKFAKLMQADRITRLHKNSTGTIEVNFYEHDFKPTKQEWQNVLDTDYSIEIETI